jgi:outer membrane immunogenic protein
MTRKLAVLIIASALTWGSGAASAGMKDDAAEAPRACGAGPFGGAYIGAAIGYGRQDAEMTDKLFGPSYDDNDSTVTGGLISGYNIQCGRVLIGIESDFDFFNTSAEASVDTIRLTSSMDWFGTSRVRLGLVHNDDTLFYVTGGLAYADVDHTFNDTHVGTIGPFSQSDNDREYGWTVGGGVEFLRGTNWTLRAEGLYVDLGSETHHYEISSGYGVCTTSCEAVTEWEDNFWVARVGLTYKLGREPEAAPLK